MGRWGVILGAVLMATGGLAWMLYVHWQNEKLSPENVQQCILLKLNEGQSGSRSQAEIVPGSVVVKRSGSGYVIKAELIVPRVAQTSRPFSSAEYEIVRSLEFEEPYIGHFLPFMVSGYQGPTPEFNPAGHLRIKVDGRLATIESRPFALAPWLHKKVPELTSLTINEKERRRVLAGLSEEPPDNAVFDIRVIAPKMTDAPSTEFQRHYYTLVAQQELRRGAVDASAALLVNSILNPPDDSKMSEELVSTAKKWKHMYDKMVAKGELNPDEQLNLAARFHDPIVKFLVDRGGNSQ